MSDIVQRLRNFAVWNNRLSHYEPVPLCGEAADQIEALVKALEEARLQLEYVQEKHGYATGEAVLARVRAALAAAGRGQ
jgi:hypothetical protein